MNRLAFASALLLVAILIGCDSGSTERPSERAASAARPPAAPVAPAATASSAAEARALFEGRCGVCHGLSGGGDGPGSAGLSPQPRDFRDPEWQASVSDEHISQIIQYGGAAVGKSPSMPGNPDLGGRPEVVAGLIQHIRSLRAE